MDKEKLVFDFCEKEIERLQNKCKENKINNTVNGNIIKGKIEAYTIIMDLMNGIGVI